MAATVLKVTFVRTVEMLPIAASVLRQHEKIGRYQPLRTGPNLNSPDEGSRSHITS